MERLTMMMVFKSEKKNGLKVIEQFFCILYIIIILAISKISALFTL